ncbi:outer membrane protein assembly factor BamD [Neptunitalea lumnitzerae]|uniref:Outer membrane protein assembly factor BamD n=1 Tax=Neptunitalea lumnitzerae TaxID=2965509 RepID=A0ABQ5MJZ8_9FLAO|nr:outer membrane protein assembly factor BamD [Neptunitalea sp. Y10]GLB49746.1 outer membrane protein assembly factor BamD [Neptunitalea sp. Y10]
MFKKIEFLGFIAVLVIFTSSCSDYQKALKSEDVKIKYDMAESLYNEGKYTKANRLFEQIMPKYAGKPQGERVVYMYADAAYKDEDYYLAAYQFERFATSYPRSQKAQEAAFYSAKSSYMLSPKYSIDQTDTYEALDKLQNFINNYPDSEWLPEANEMVQELTLKIERKELEIAKNYSKTFHYKASIKSIDNFLVDYPGSELKEEALYVRLNASYELAINSYEYLVKDRLLQAQEAYQELIEDYPNTQFSEEATEINESIEKELSKRS